ncbi:MAG: hypothetical protein ACKN9E_11705 [Microcystaceae cyanobacterium]
MSERLPHFAVCINNQDYPVALERHKIYQVVPDPSAEKDGDLRIIDESGEDYLYPARYFVIIEVPKLLEKSLLQAS